MRRAHLVYFLTGGTGVLLYGAGEAYGWETGTVAKERVGKPGPNVRRSPGGWRAWGYWHRGYRGGK